MILHTVAFRTKHNIGSAEEIDFLVAGKSLGDLPMVHNFKCYKQIGKKNDFDYGFSMEFGSQAEYDAYNNHPRHIEFVQTRWLHEVVGFMEIDYVPHDVS